MKCFVYQSQSAIAKSGNPYFYQNVEIYQRPRRPNVEVRQFLANENEALPPGEYECDVDFQATPTGPKPVFHSFRLIAEAN